MVSKPRWNSRKPCPPEYFRETLLNLLKEEGGRVTLDHLSKITGHTGKPLKKQINEAMRGGGIAWESRRGSGASEAVVLGARQKRRRKKTECAA